MDVVDTQGVQIFFSGYTFTKRRRPFFAEKIILFSRKKNMYRLRPYFAEKKVWYQKLQKIMSTGKNNYVNNNKFERSVVQKRKQ